MNYKQLLDIAYLDKPQKFDGFLTVASLYFNQSDKKIIWRLLRKEYKKDFNKQMPFPIYQDRTLFEEIKKWICVKTATKYIRI